MSISDDRRHGVIQRNMTRPVIDETTAGSGSTTREFVIPTSGVVVGVLATSVASGTLSVSVYTYDGDTSSSAKELLTFDIPAATGTWVVKKSDLCLNRIKIVATYTGVCSYIVSAKAVEDGVNPEEARPVDITGPATAFGEVKVAQLTPTIQVEPTLGLRTNQDVETYTASGGAVTAEDTGTGYEFKCAISTTSGSYALVRSKRANAYRPGQGSLFRFTARFDAGVANSTLRAGAVTVGTELSFGYNGTRFGILHRTGGKVEIATLQLTVPAGGAETATVTLNGTAFTVSLTAGTLKHNAYQLGAATYSGWTVIHADTYVKFYNDTVGNLSGTFSFSSTGAAAGTFTNVNGASVTDTWYYQEDWNIDPMDGTGPSAMLLNKQKGNVYQVQYQYLGYGQILFSIENPATGRYIPVHRIEYANANTSPSILSPYLKVGMFAASLGSTIALNTYCASMMGAVEGCITPKRNPDGHLASATDIGTSFAPVLMLRVRNEINSVINISELRPLLASCAVEGTKPAEFKVVINPTITGEPDWQLHKSDTTQGLHICTTTGLTISTGANTLEVANLGLGKSGDVTVNLKDFDIRLGRLDVIALCVRATAATTDATCGLTWIED